MLASGGALGIAAAACASLLGVDDVSYYAAPPDGSQIGRDGPFAPDGAPTDGPSLDGPALDTSRPDGAVTSERAAAYAAAVLADKPIAYWRLSDSDAGSCRNEVDGGYTATYQGKIEFGAQGIFDDDNERAVFLSDQASLPVALKAGAAPLDFPGGRNFALEAWVKRSGADASDDVLGAQLQFTAEPEPKPFLGITLFVYPGRSIARFERWFGPDHLGPLEVESTAAVTPGQFHHVVVSVTGDEMRLFVDTKQTLQGGGTAADANAMGFVWGPLLGALDEIAIYDHALTEERVKAHYAAALTGP